MWWWIFIKFFATTFLQDQQSQDSGKVSSKTLNGNEALQDVHIARNNRNFAAERQLTQETAATPLSMQQYVCNVNLMVAMRWVDDLVSAVMSNTNPAGYKNSDNTEGIVYIVKHIKQPEKSFWKRNFFDRSFSGCCSSSCSPL